MIEAIDAVRVKGNSIGGVVTCIARDCPRVRTPPPKKNKKIIIIIIKK
jgi:chorismate synthase